MKISVVQNNLQGPKILITFYKGNFSNFLKILLL